jgi:uncharacterized protein (TIGR02594 family)
VERESFVRQCILVERSFNKLDSTAPWFVSADFLIARALIETNIENPGPSVGSNAVGPLRVSSSEWSRFLTSGSALAEGYKPTDYDYSTLQVYGAAYSMHVDSKAISDAIPRDSRAQITDDPFIPSYLDLFHAYLADARTAIAVRSAESDQTKTLGDVLSQQQIAAIIARSQFNGLDASTKISDFVAKTESILNTALQAAFNEIKKLAPDELPQSQPGKATWFDFAVSEENAHVTEATQPGRIKSYFLATDHGAVGPHAPIPHWCGAFVAFCISQSGNGKSIPKGAAVAAKWKGWGVKVPIGSDRVPVGAVVVLTPSPGTNTSGHVAFFVSLGAGKVKLLGGNQSDEVNETSYSTSRLAAIRWLETQPVGNGAATAKFDLAAAGVPKKFWQFGDMIVDRFGRAGFSEVQQLAALANAIGESGLDPTIKSPGAEQSFGLFQCNRTHGLGKGFTIDELKDPETNIAIVIKKAKNVSQFFLATTMETAVGAFVRFIEIPLDIPGATIKRIKIAKKLTS